MTLEEHARAIEAAIQAAHRDGFHLDDGEGEPVYALELNAIERGEPTGEFVAVRLPETYWH
jgi:hypothetical protein